MSGTNNDPSDMVLAAATATGKGRARLRTAFNPFMAKNIEYQPLHDPGSYTAENSGTSNDPNDTVLAATESDVVTGKGRARQAGNLKYRHTVDSNKVLYARCQDKDKWKVTKGVIDAVKSYGGRFLKYDKKKGTYRTLNDKDVHDRVSQALRLGQPKTKKQIYAAEDRGVPQETKTFSEESYKQYSTYILGKFRHDDQPKTPDVAELICLSKIDSTVCEEENSEPERVQVSSTMQTQCSSLSSSNRSGSTAPTVAETLNDSFSTRLEDDPDLINYDLASYVFNDNSICLEQARSDDEWGAEDDELMNEPNEFLRYGLEPEVEISHSEGIIPNGGSNPTNLDSTENNSANENDSHSSGSSMSWIRISDHNDEKLGESLRSADSDSLCAITSSMLEGFATDLTRRIL